MGFFSNYISLFTGSKQAKAARAAADIQSKGATQAIGEVRAGATKATGRLEPFAAEGRKAITNISDLVTDPVAQRAFIEENPFFEALTTRSRDELFATRAARGKIASGETAEELQERFLTIGSDLLAQNIKQRLNIGNVGLTASGGQADIDVGASRNIANLITGRSAVEAGGVMGATNARIAGAQNFLDTGLAIAGLFTGGGGKTPTGGSNIPLPQPRPINLGGVG